MFWDGMHGWEGWWMGAGWMMLLWVAIIGVGVWAIYRLTRSSQHQQPTPHPLPDPRPRPESPLEILDRRFASGDLDVDEYSDRRARLEHKRVK
jgi:putative membrane protein